MRVCHTRKALVDVVKAKATHSSKVMVRRAEALHEFVEAVENCAAVSSATVHKRIASYMQQEKTFANTSFNALFASAVHAATELAVTCAALAEPPELDFSSAEKTYSLDVPLTLSKVGASYSFFTMKLPIR